MNPQSPKSPKVETDNYPKVEAFLAGFTLQIQTNEDSQELNTTVQKQFSFWELLRELISTLIRKLVGGFQEKSLTTTSDRESPVVQKVLESAIECLKSEGFNPQNYEHYRDVNYNPDLNPGLDLNPDLIEIPLELRPDDDDYRKKVAAKAWDATYKLHQIDKVIYAEPSFSLMNPSDRCASPDIEETPIPTEVLQKVINDPEWHLKQMHVKEAWELLKKDKGKRPGEGITIAHPDTGYLPHPELDPVHFPSQGKQDSNLYLEGDRRPFSIKDVLAQERYSASNLPVTFWHGTATASLIVSPEGGPQIKSKGKRFVTGVAPGATLKPYRLGPNRLDRFEYFSPLLAKAINDAAKKADDENIRVISISIGGYPTLALRRAIINAQRQGIIVVAAAGNRVPFAIWPSTYANVISVASSDFAGKAVAAHSAIGSRVDVAAPSECIMVAVPKVINGNLTFTVHPRSGTSYAAPLVAGVAALWLSYWGWDYLLEKYENDPTRIPLAFDKLLRETCYEPEGWNTSRWGAGIVDAYKLLKTDPPEPDDPYIQEALAYQETDHIGLDMGGIKTFAYLLEKTISEQSLSAGLTAQIIRPTEIGEGIFWRVFGQVFGKTGKELRQYLRVFGREIAFLLATDFTFYREMEELLKNLVDLSIGNFTDKWSAMVKSSTMQDIKPTPVKTAEDELRATVKSSAMLSKLKEKASERLKKYLNPEPESVQN